MHSNLTPFLAKQRVADLRDQAARYRAQHPSAPKQPAEPRPVQSVLRATRPATRTVHRRRTA